VRRLVDKRRTRHPEGPKVIPDAAVEAAIYAYGVDGKAHEWERKMILNILEAAAPFIEEAGYSRGFDDGHMAGQESMETE
jgi:hypothetical protein